VQRLRGRFKRLPLSCRQSSSSWILQHLGEEGEGIAETDLIYEDNNEE
jgi:hypothetical protein